MKKSTSTKHSVRLAGVALGLIVLLSIICFTGCKTVEQPESNARVYSVNLQYNGANVDGQLSVDLSMEKVNLAAKILQDGSETAVYESSDKSVATISPDGVVTLISVGETKIKATAGGKTHSIVLIVKNDYSGVASNTITVIGGVAKNASGEVVTSAKTGDYLTLVPSMPDHKDFVEWQYSSEDLWINGNVIKMPEGELTVTAEYTDTLYKLNLIGAKATKANLTENPSGTAMGGTSVEDIQTVYEFAYGTEITIVANASSNDRLFVGWDKNIENNRVGEEGVSTYTFEMTGEDSTITAVFSDIRHNILPGANVDSEGNSASVYNPKVGQEGVTAKKITAGVIEGSLSADPDLQGLYGYSFSIAGNTVGTKAWPENIQKSDLNTKEVLEPMTVKIIFKNRGDLPVTVELGYSYFGNIGSTGAVTVPAGEIVVKGFSSNIGLNDCSWSFTVRESVGGTADDVIPLDVVVAAAQTYPTGYPLLKGDDDTEYMTFGGSLAINTGWKRIAQRASYNDKGAQLFVSRESNMDADQASAYAKVTNLPEYDPENPTTTVYVQVLNLVNAIDNSLNKFSIMFSSSTNAFDTTVTPLASAVVDIQEAGQVILLKLEIPRAENEGDIYMHFVKYQKEAGMEYNVFAQFAYNNAFGYKEEN